MTATDTTAISPATLDHAALDTRRLRLRLFQSGNDSDLALYRDIYGDAAVMHRIAEPLTVEAAVRGFANVCRHNRAQTPGHRFWRVDEQTTGRRAGLAALRREGARAEIGVMLFPEWWNRGVCGEIFVALLHYGFTDLGLGAIDARSAEDDGLPVIERLLAPFGFIRTRAGAPDGIGHWELPKAVWESRRSAN
ncbi:GNAT family N-acetyltransferase [Lysobacter yangpyeongensis]|uniref:GNAT family N-acetyltransferase n=1 Tax=Lysobacter yangpyeongensis TaxID=346182 RepID=A0ABW0SNS4_9GAMM